MGHDEQVKTIVLGRLLELNSLTKTSSWINFLRKLFVLLKLKAICNLGKTPVLYITLLKNERGILFHLLAPLSSFVVSVLINFDFLYRQQIFTLKLNVQLNSLTSLSCNHVIKLACEVFTWEGEVLRQDDLTQDVLSVALFKALLVHIRKSPIHLFGLIGDDLI